MQGLEATREQSCKFLHHYTLLLLLLNVVSKIISSNAKKQSSSKMSSEMAWWNWVLLHSVQFSSVTSQETWMFKGHSSRSSGHVKAYDYHLAFRVSAKQMKITKFGTLVLNTAHFTEAHEILLPSYVARDLEVKAIFLTFRIYLTFLYVGKTCNDCNNELTGQGLTETRLLNWTS